MHHYSTVTCFFIVQISSKQRTWQVAIPKEAVSHEFLMHALLALAAVHLMYNSPKQRHAYEEAATRHQYLALTSPIPFLHNITRTNCHALFALSNVVSVLNLVYPSSTGLQSDPLDNILDFFVVIRGVKTVLKSASEWIANGSLAQLISYDWHPTMFPLREDVKNTFERLEERNEETSEDPATCQMYTLAIRGLRKAFQTCQVISEEPGLVFSWPVLVLDTYIAAIRMREPMALAILGHYAVLLHSVNSQWWLEGRGSFLIETICQQLPRDWLPFVAWPRGIIQKSWDGMVDFVPAGGSWRPTDDRNHTAEQRRLVPGFTVS